MKTFKQFIREDWEGGKWVARTDDGHRRTYMSGIPNTPKNRASVKAAAKKHGYRIALRGRGGQAGGRAGNKEQFGVDTVFPIDPKILREKPNRIAGLQRTV